MENIVFYLTLFAAMFVGSILFFNGAPLIVTFLFNAVVAFIAVFGWEFLK